MDLCQTLSHKEGDMPEIEQCERADTVAIGGDQVPESSNSQ